jgi:hypothetical protein
MLKDGEPDRLVTCLRCAGVILDRAPESPTGIDFFECPACHRRYAKKPGGVLTYRWLHPVTLALYGVIFEEDPVRLAVPQAEHFLKHRLPHELLQIVEEIELELNQPTQNVRDALENRATEERYREYLRAFVAHIRARLREQDEPVDLNQPPGEA